MYIVPFTFIPGGVLYLLSGILHFLSCSVLAHTLVPHFSWVSPKADLEQGFRCKEFIYGVGPRGKNG